MKIGWNDTLILVYFNSTKANCAGNGKKPFAFVIVMKNAFLFLRKDESYRKTLHPRI
jgi:hypothetical protein